ncbi:hypothetical protein [Pseudoxanthomonas sp. SE1]|uniref:hypothetical protein n=1 Tax=Pseudoxanthomonas sp. SE1 TaxID=1664560 RepID=UPI00240DC799|nr:hypothetical protein [Pseudoxanthomonas sp. SE1]WFC43167.1 hypothetical protein OY559_06570 [Pseudoxanthomonas sp. SE1]
MPITEQFQRVQATFQPRRTDDLAPGVATLIGRPSEWVAAWRIERGPYAGEWAMQPLAPEFHVFGWAPEGDLQC